MIKTDLSNVEPIPVVFKDNCIPVTFASSDYFAPYLGVTLKSIIDCSDNNYNYDFVVFTKDMSEANKRVLKTICSPKNISLRFVNVKEIFKELRLFTPGHLAIETYFRLVIPVFMKNYSKILFLDCDLIVKDDVKNLFEYYIDGFAVGACIECLMSSLLGIHGDKLINYMYETLKLKDANKYFQAGVMILNVDYFNQNNCCEQLMEMVQNYDYKILDQDALNHLLNAKCLWLPNEWNYPPMQTHMNDVKYVENMSEMVRNIYVSVKEPKIIHYADREKPWFDPMQEMAQAWWDVARTTPYYEEIIRRMNENFDKRELMRHKSLLKEYSKNLDDICNYKKNVLRYWKYKLLSPFTFGNTKERYKTKKLQYKRKIWSAKKYIH